MIVSALQGDTLDLLCWRHMGTTAGVVEEAYRINPGLADQGPILPEGIAVTLPERPASTPATRETVNLWD